MRRTIVIAYYNSRFIWNLSRGFFPSRRKGFPRKYLCSCVWLISWWLIKLLVEFLNIHKIRLWSQQVVSVLPLCPTSPYPKIIYHNITMLKQIFHWNHWLLSLTLYMFDRSKFEGCRNFINKTDLIKKCKISVRKVILLHLLNQRIWNNWI